MSDALDSVPMSRNCYDDGLTVWQLCSLALNETEHLRLELENLYAESCTIGGEVRYHLLWRLSELERICGALLRCAKRLFPQEEDMAPVREQVAELARRAGELRKEAWVLIEAWHLPVPINAPCEAEPPKRIRQGSGRSSSRSAPYAV